MSIQIRPSDGIDDYRAIAELLAVAGHQEILPGLLMSQEAPGRAPVVRRRCVAVDAEGAIVGTSYLQHEARMPEGQFGIFVAVARGQRQHGIGSQLYTEAEVYARTLGAAELLVTLPDDVPAAQFFAEHRDFVLHQHWVHWRLALMNFDEAPFIDALRKAQSRRLSFLTLAEAGNTPDNQQKLYELNRRTSLDAPGEVSFPSFDEFVRDVLNAPWFRPDSQILAADARQWVGLASVGIDGQTAFNAFTGVDRIYRRQGLGLALTLLSIRYARQHYTTHLESFNDSRNTPLFRLQEKLGYLRVPGRYIMKHSLGK